MSRRIYQIKAFTLVELLVVISIIALLLSILMPSLSKAREQAQKIVCLSNLKTASLTWQLYSISNRGIVVPVNTIGTNELWVDLLMPYMEQNKKLRVLSPMKPDKTAFMCPGNKEYFIDAAAQVHSFNYALNNRSGITWSDGTPQWQPTKLQDIKQPSAKIIFSDSQNDWQVTYAGKRLKTVSCWSDPTTYYKTYNYRVGLIHGGKMGANFLWADGHSTFEFKKNWNTNNLYDRTGIGWWELSEKLK